MWWPAGPDRADAHRDPHANAAAALAGVERIWLDGWLLQAGHGSRTWPLIQRGTDISGTRTPSQSAHGMRAVIWPWLAVPGACCHYRPTGEVSAEQECWCGDVSTGEPDQSRSRCWCPDDTWLRLTRSAYPRHGDPVMTARVAFGGYLQGVASHVQR